MKVTRSYWLGLGSGLILSAMLAVVISPQQKQAVIPQVPSPVPIAKEQATTQPLTNTQPPAATQPSQAQPPNTQISTQIEQNFIIPKGASSERIADLLVSQCFIKDKKSFLAIAHQMGVESQFIAGTFTLSQGLTSEELIHRLMNY